jgi:hypothetical protein
MVAFVLSAALALFAHTGSHAVARGHLPMRGVVIPGVSLAGIRIGDTEQHVREVWGSNFVTCKYCSDPTWLYEYESGEPLGTAARFQKGKVVAVFTLGSPAGWRTNKGLYIGDPISNAYQFFSRTGATRCIGFDAITMRQGNVVTAIYSSAGVVYGFALVTPAMTVCQ